MIKERWQEGPRPKTPSPRPRFPVSLTLSLKHKPLNHRTRRELRVQQDTIQEMLEPQPSLLEEPGPEFTHDALPRESGDHGFGVREGAHEVRAMLDRLMLVVVVGEGVLSLAGSSVLVLVVWGKTEIRHDQTTLFAAAVSRCIGAESPDACCSKSSVCRVFGTEEWLGGVIHQCS
ncbi:hypothetical protein KC323_g289 [Hortaea werneckii]|nr:hypothetical protein KC323_g289 [Hortaea werneckii]